MKLFAPGPSRGLLRNSAAQFSLGILDYPFDRLRNGKGDEKANFLSGVQRAGQSGKRFAASGEQKAVPLFAGQLKFIGFGGLANPLRIHRANNRLDARRMFQ